MALVWSLTGENGVPKVILCLHIHARILDKQNHPHRLTTVPQGLEGCSLLGITASLF